MKLKTGIKKINEWLEKNALGIGIIVCITIMFIRIYEGTIDYFSTTGLLRITILILFIPVLIASLKIYEKTIQPYEQP